MTPHTAPLQVHTARLLLRPWRDADRAPFAAMNADEEVMAHFPSVQDRAGSDAAVDRFVDHWRQHGYGPWAVELPGATPFAGFVGLLRPSFTAHFTPAVEIGWRLARQVWGRGYAPEAAAATLDVAFDVLGLDEVVSFTTPDNHKSRRVMEKIGMATDPDEDFDHPNVADGPYRRHVLYRLAASDWRVRRAAATSP